MEMVGRNWSEGEAYRFGHNGQEKSKEVGEDNYTAEFWEYDSQVIRRFNTDPIVKEYESPYLAFGGNPIWFSDVNGDDAEDPGKGGKTQSTDPSRTDFKSIPDPAGDPLSRANHIDEKPYHKEIKNAEYNWVSMYSRDSEGRKIEIACATASERMINNMGFVLESNWWDKSTYFTGVSENSKGRQNPCNLTFLLESTIQPTESIQKDYINQIKKAINDGIPIILGINGYYSNGNEYFAKKIDKETKKFNCFSNDGFIDHYVVCVGYGFEKEKGFYLQFFDNSSGNKDECLGKGKTKNRLYLSKKEDILNMRGLGTYIDSQLGTFYIPTKK
ncbi:MAG: hypothetical protein EAZ06_10200 [Cytophagales bacterium]|nr:MAG: hypothetical protein EAZ06_10200 [Cytophagales bacterium]